jgi:hypothetical protein
MEKPQADFAALAARENGGSLIRECMQFLSHTKKWWLFPVLVALLLAGTFFVLSTSAAAPLIYTLF